MFTILLEAANKNPSEELMFSGNAVLFLCWIDSFPAKGVQNFIEIKSVTEILLLLLLLLLLLFSLAYHFPACPKVVASKLYLVWIELIWIDT